MMAWFSLWMPLALQLVVPLLLVGWIARGRDGRSLRAAAAVVTALYLVAIWLAGLWLVLPWWLPFAQAALLLVAYSSASFRTPPQPREQSASDTVRRLSLGLGGVLVVTAILVALRARTPPGDVVDLAFPFDAGTFLVVNGGSHVLINAHLATLEGERFRPFRGQSYGVDLVRIDRVGLRAHGLLPDDPRAWWIFGNPVVAPCAGQVVAAADGAPDMAPPQPDRSHMAGNHVILACADAWVLLGHLQRGSVAVHPGESVALGAGLGRVGNSGNTGEPHLHIHAQRPGPDAEPMSGDPLPIRLDGRYLVRNARVTVAPRANAK